MVTTDTIFAKCEKCGIGMRFSGEAVCSWCEKVEKSLPEGPLSDEQIKKQIKRTINREFICLWNLLNFFPKTKISTEATLSLIEAQDALHLAVDERFQSVVSPSEAKMELIGISKICDHLEKN
jgi:uncharacterized Zn finger protein (UPF0148 family)